LYSKTRRCGKKKVLEGSWHYYVNDGMVGGSFFLFGKHFLYQSLGFNDAFFGEDDRLYLSSGSVM